MALYASPLRWIRSAENEKIKVSNVSCTNCHFLFKVSVVSPWVSSDDAKFWQCIYFLCCQIYVRKVSKDNNIKGFRRVVWQDNQHYSHTVLCLLLLVFASSFNTHLNGWLLKQTIHILPFFEFSTIFILNVVNFQMLYSIRNWLNGLYNIFWVESGNLSGDNHERSWSIGYEISLRLHFLFQWSPVFYSAYK